MRDREEKKSARARFLLLSQTRIRTSSGSVRVTYPTKPCTAPHFSPRKRLRSSRHLQGPLDNRLTSKSFTVPILSRFGPISFHCSDPRQCCAHGFVVMGMKPFCAGFMSIHRQQLHRCLVPVSRISIYFKVRYVRALHSMRRSDIKTTRLKQLVCD